VQSVTIAVWQAGSAAARTLAVEVGVQGKKAAKRALTPVEAQQAKEIASQYHSLQQGSGRQAAAGYLSILADMLFHLFLEPAWQNARDCLSPGADTELTVTCSLPEVLQLPWELLSISARTEGLFAAGLGVIRCPRDAGRPEGAAPEAAPVLSPAPAPLRLLFLAANLMDADGDEQAVLAAAEGLDARLHICESGEAAELKQLAGSLHPHLVMLSCQVEMAGGGAAFSLPGPDGRPHLLAAEDLAAALGDSRAAGIILTGRQSDSPSVLHLLGCSLAESFPFVLTWNASAAGAARLLRPLAEGRDMVDAVRSLMAGMNLAESPDPLPQLYTLFRPSPLFDREKRAADERASSLCRPQAAVPGTNQGRAVCFVDRRQEMQRLLPALHDGSVQSLIITGPEGGGKSCLASRLASKMASSGYGILTVYGSSYNRITAARLIEAAATHFRAGGMDETAGALKDSGRPLRKRLDGLLEALKGSPTLLIWDGLSLDGKTGRIPDPELAAFYMQMNRDPGSSRAVITCPALPADAPTLPARARQWKLEGLGRAAFVRFLLGEEAVAEGYRSGRIAFSELAEHHEAAGGRPALISQTAKALATASAGALSAGEDPAARLLALLENESRLALCRAAVFEVAVSPAGLASASGVAEKQIPGYASRWQELSLAFSQDGLWSVPGPIRSSLVSALSPEEQHAAQKAAGGFLKELAAAGRSAEILLTRLDALLEARGHLLAAQDASGAADVTASISGYLLRRGYYSELIRLNQELLAFLEGLGPAAAASMSAGPAGWIARAHLDCEQFREAELWYGRALHLAESPAFHHGLGLSLLHQGKHDAARANLQKAVEDFQRVGDASGEAAALGSLSALHMKLGENDMAGECLSRIAGIMKAKGDVQGEAAAWQDLARLDMVKGSFDTARERLVRSHRLLARAGDASGSSIALFNLASLDMEKGDLAKAGEEFKEALPLFEARGDDAGSAAIHHSLGMIYSHAGEKERAKKCFQAALSLSQKQGDRAAEAGAFFQLGVLAVQQSHAAEGLRLMALAAVLLRSIKSDEVKSVEPIVERLAAQLGYSQERFLAMVQEVLSGYARDRGRGLAEMA